MLDARHLGTIIYGAVSTGRPFSLVRLGDGEGALLRFDENATSEDIEYLRTHFGPHSQAADFKAIAANLREALRTADFIGIRDDVLGAVEAAQSLTGDEPGFTARYKAALPLREVERPGIGDHALRRIFGLTQWLRSEYPENAGICSQWALYDLALQNFWGPLIATQRKIGLIHCSPELPDALTSLFGVEVEFHQVPDKAMLQSDLWGDQSGVQQFPDRYAEATAWLDRPLDGQLFFVGAGLAGKGYLATIKRNGGIALDVGALLDAWDGRSSRPLVYSHKSPSDPTHRPFALAACGSVEAKKSLDWFMPY